MIRFPFVNEAPIRLSAPIEIINHIIILHDYLYIRKKDKKDNNHDPVHYSVFSTINNTNLVINNITIILLKYFSTILFQTI